MDGVTVCGKKGTLHFIRFPTAEMSNFLELAKKKGMATLVTTVCATGGGAFKFEEAFRRVRLPSYRLPFTRPTFALAYATLRVRVRVRVIHFIAAASRRDATRPVAHFVRFENRKCDPNG